MLGGRGVCCCCMITTLWLLPNGVPGLLIGVVGNPGEDLLNGVVENPLPTDGLPRGVEGNLGVLGVVGNLGVLGVRIVGDGV